MFTVLKLFHTSSVSIRGLLSLGKYKNNKLVFRFRNDDIKNCKYLYMTFIVQKMDII